MTVSELSYGAAAPTLDSQLLKMQAAVHEALFDQTPLKFAAQVIRRMSELNLEPVHCLNNSAASTGAVLVPAGQPADSGPLANRPRHGAEHASSARRPRSAA